MDGSISHSSPRQTRSPGYFNVPVESQFNQNSIKKGMSELSPHGHGHVHHSPRLGGVEKPRLPSELLQTGLDLSPSTEINTQPGEEFISPGSQHSTLDDPLFSLSAC